MDSEGFLRLQDVALALFSGKLKGKTFEIDRMAGTGFVPVSGVLVTCWHCVRPILDKVDFAADFVAPGGSVKLLPLTRVSQCPSGLDLATAAVDYEATDGFNLCPPPGYSGLDVWSVGYPLTTRTLSDRKSVV